MRLAIPLAWLLVAETAYDTVTNVQGGVREHLMGAASGTTWFVLVFYVPLVVVSAVMIAWQLYARRHEALDAAAGIDRATREAKIAQSLTGNDVRRAQNVHSSSADRTGMII
jgi:hypothetical protein